MYSTKYFLFIFVLFIGISANCQVINTIAGNGTSGWHGDGEYATSAQLSWPEHVRADNAGNIYIADFLNGRIRKVDTFGIITTIAGNGLNVYSGDGGPAAYASIEYPISLGFDGAGNLYIAEDSSYAWSGIGMGGSRIRKVDAAGIITTIAGNSYGGAGGFIGDGGPATAAQFYSVFDIAVDAIGNIYICDLGNLRIRKIDTAGIINTIAGSGAYGWSGDGGPAIEAEFTTPMGITVDGTGNVYIADFTNNNIRKVDTFGIISTIAGNLMYGFSGDSGQATAAELWSPTGRLSKSK
jgi:trimeric autotransporter adhesin